MTRKMQYVTSKKFGIILSMDWTDYTYRHGMQRSSTRSLEHHCHHPSQVSEIFHAKKDKERYAHCFSVNDLA